MYSAISDSNLQLKISLSVVSRLTRNTSTLPERKSRTLHKRIVAGSLVLLSGSSLTTAINLLYNILVARFIGPKGFGQATVVYTILTLISAVTLSFQIVSAKVMARQTSPEAGAGAYRLFHRSAWVVGLFIALFLILFQKPIAVYLNLSSPMLVALLALGAGFYVPLGSRRGYIQGTYGFRRLATNLVVEGAVRLAGSFLLILLGLGVEGVIAANAAAVAVAYFSIAPRLVGRAPTSVLYSQALRETFQAMIFFAGQVLINNCDIVLVKHFFAADEAGLYAAVAMVGRVIFAFSSAVVNSMFPLVAGTRDEDRKDIRVIVTSLLLVLATGSILALGLGLAPARLWTLLFGSGFAISGKYNLPYLLALYAVTTIVYSLTVVMISFEMSYKIANTSWVQLAFSGVVIAAIIRFHSSLREVIFVQLILMTVLLATVAIPFVMDLLHKTKHTQPHAAHPPVRLTRLISENEVIAEFLKSDFQEPEFEQYHARFDRLVEFPDFDSAPENAMRRSLLFLRHRALWREIPARTTWYQVEITHANIHQIRVFPRAQWRKLARGNFSMDRIADGMRARQHLLSTPFASKIASIGDQLMLNEPGMSAIILIGLNDKEPLTVLDGNHRLAAAMLSSPNKLDKLSFICGLSPHMNQCCWYRTNLFTLIRYGIHMFPTAWRNPANKLARLT